jgi:hypothetical protein
MANPAEPYWPAGVSCVIEHRRRTVMGGKRFDALTATLAANGGSRRRIVKGVMAGALTAGLTTFGVGEIAAAAVYPHCCGRLKAECRQQCREGGGTFVFHECVEGAGGICQSRNCGCDSV